MVDVCNLCKALYQQEEKKNKKESETSIKPSYDKLIAHVRIHRSHLRLVNGSAPSVDELLEKCFLTKSDEVAANNTIICDINKASDLQKTKTKP